MNGDIFLPKVSRILTFTFQVYGVGCYKKKTKTSLPFPYTGNNTYFNAPHMNPYKLEWLKLQDQAQRKSFEFSGKV
jgi:hypothetical protein